MHWRRDSRLVIQLYPVLFHFPVQGCPVYAKLAGCEGTIITVLGQGFAYQVGLHLGGGVAEESTGFVRGSFGVLGASEGEPATPAGTPPKFCSGQT